MRGVWILTGDLEAIDLYERVTITILNGIMGIGGLDSSELRCAMKNARKYFQAVRDWILQSQTTPQAGRSTPASQPRKPAGASAFAIEEDSDFLASIGIPSQVPENPETALQTAMADLESMIGLPGVKDEVKRPDEFLENRAGATETWPAGIRPNASLRFHWKPWYRENDCRPNRQQDSLRVRPAQNDEGCRVRPLRPCGRLLGSNRHQDRRSGNVGTRRRSFH